MKDGVIAHHLVAHEAAPPQRWMLVLHGVFGMGANFRAFARQLAARAPGWGFVLCDLRAHGESLGLAPPHHLDAAARDLVRLEAHLGLRVGGVLGHSFGGKVALAWLAQRSTPAEIAFVLDSMPGARPPGDEVDGARTVLEVLESLPPTFVSRDEFKRVLAARGFSSAIVDWLAMNVRRAGDAYALRLDLPAIRDMLLDYWARDLWDVVADPTRASRLVLVVAGKSSVFDAAGRARAQEIAASHPHVVIEEMPRAGHWIHADDPDGLREILLRHLG